MGPALGLLLAAVGLPASARASARGRAEQQAAAAAVKIEQEHDYDAGIKLALRATTTDPTDDSGWYWLGTGYLKAARYTDAIPALKRTLELGPTGDRLWSTYDELATAYHWTQNTEALKNLYQNVSPLPPATAYQYFERGSFYVKCGALGYAIRDFHLAAILEPNNAIYARDLEGAVTLVDSVYGNRYQRNPGFDELLVAKEAAVEVGRWRNRRILEAKDGLLPAALRNDKTTDLQALKTRIEETMLDLTHESASAKDHAELAATDKGALAAYAVVQQRELSLVYQERIELLKPMLAAARDELANRQK
jgi:tetratricopeptide (TPR) repeat protein